MFRYLLLGLLPALVTGFSAPAMAFFGDFGLPQEVKTALKDSPSVNVSDRVGFIRFWPRASESRSDQCFVFYPGANVSANAYAPITRALAEAGFPSYILKVPAGLAILEPFAADRAKLDSHRPTGLPRRRRLLDPSEQRQGEQGPTWSAMAPRTDA